MEATQPIAPTANEIRQQLRRMLNSSTFVKRRKPSMVFEFVVNSALNDAAVEEKDILDALFPAEDYGVETTVARTNAAYMRELVNRYYNTEGKLDMVVIQFPKDLNADKKKRTANYRPSFSYASDHIATKAYVTGLRYLKQKNPLALHRALKFFHDALKNQPDRVEINIGMAEALVGMALFQQFPVKHYGAAGEYASKAVELAPADWRAHASLGAVYLVNQYEMANAATEFKAALEINADATRGYGWYQAFLFASGERTAAALELAKASADLNKDDPDAQAIIALWLYGARLFDESAARLGNALRLEPNNRFAQLCSALLYLAQGKPKNAMRSIKMFQVPFDGAQWRAYGIEAVCVESMGEFVIPTNSVLTDVRFPLQLEQESVIGGEVECAEDQIEISGLSYTNHEGGARGPRASFGSMLEDDGPFSNPYPVDGELSLHFSMPTPAMNAALSAMAQQDFESALHFLQSAWERYEAFVLWLHMMPIFDPLQKLDGFHQILTRRLTSPPGE